MNEPRSDPAGDAVSLATFDEHRGLLFSIAYRMLGSVTDAEDMLQEAFIRWQQASKDELRSPRALLVTIVSRLCISHLQSARVQREQYVGQWLPEPLVTDPRSDPLGVLKADESLSMALLVLLERLTPVERAVFILHEVFRFKYAEIAAALGQSEANCRQVLHRARGHVGIARRRFTASAREHENLLERFLAASREGDVNALVTLLADDVVLHADGGGKAIAVPNIIRGIDKVGRALAGGMRLLPATLFSRTARVNGQPGVISYVDGKPFSVLTLDIRDGRIAGIFIVTNPRKLAHLPNLDHEGGGR
ncbi:MAG TPA: sigma-70 family RNA polymerase sigma factor [Candidatus Limnocylindria bacterium]|nr:sigma-70 family RNA polymerase sigma factor [Candidatus Limnocylindria bacterium]